MTYGSLFAGIGGVDLGLERAGMQCKWQVEINPFCRKVLAKHWPDVRRHDDVKTFPPNQTEDWYVDLIAGGFPCQPVSRAGKQLVQRDERWLWPEFERILRTLRPRYAVLENTPGLLDGGLDEVLGDLASLGYAAEWDGLPAAAFGANHIRDRIFILAHADRERPAERGKGSAVEGESAGGRNLGRGRGGDPWQERMGGSRQVASILPHAESRRARQLRRVEREGYSEGEGDLHWPKGESRIPRVADGVPDRVERNTALGNAVCPPIAEWLGRLVIEHSMKQEPTT